MKRSFREMLQDKIKIEENRVDEIGKKLDLGTNLSDRAFNSLLAERSEHYAVKRGMEMALIAYEISERQK